jgi:hypothetical protein
VRERARGMEGQNLLNEEIKESNIITETCPWLVHLETPKVEE